MLRAWTSRLLVGAMRGGTVSACAPSDQTGYVVRAAVPDDVGTAAGLLGQVFESYPWTTWTVEGSDRKQRLSGLYQVVLDSLRARGCRRLALADS